MISENLQHKKSAAYLNNPEENYENKITHSDKSEVNIYNW